MRNTAIDIVKRIQDNEHAAMLVGGCVRDHFFNVEPNDFDICTDMPIHRLKELFDTREIGLDSSKVNVIGVIIEGEVFEVAEFRSEAYNEGDRVPVTKPAKTIEEDLLRRDFSINSMAFDPINLELIDIFGGVKDIESKIIKTTGCPVKSFSDDPLRLLRAVRFSARFGFEIEKETLEAMKKLSHKISIISQERIRMELEKIVMTDNVEKAFRILHETGILAIILPELDRVFGFDQNSKWHVFTLEEHILKAVDRSAKILEVRLALLFHDIAKQDCLTTDEQGSHFFGHDRESSKMAKEIMTRLKFTNKQIELVVGLVFLHMARLNDFGNKGIRKMVDMIAEKNIQLLKEVWVADELSHAVVNKNGLDNALTKFEKIEQFVMNPNTNIKISNLEVNGSDLTAIGFKGKRIGDTLKKLLSMVLDFEVANKRSDLIQVSLKMLNIGV